ncbi:MAG: alkaline phosphatase family protein [Chloroflexi bacterium]|nr:alkaline phosphatase family protein [Chloroflexota bacterium]
MTEQTKRVYVIGLDGMMLPMYERFAAEGLLPNLKKLADAGIVGEAYPSMPVWTPTNWTTLATGAHTGTHSVSRWFLNLPTPRHEEQTLSAFVRSAVAAENVFEAAAKADLKSVAIHYPAASPSQAPLAHVIDGFGHPSYGTTPFEVTPAWGYTNLKSVTNSTRISLQPARAATDTAGSVQASLLDTATQPSLEDGTWANLPEQAAGGKAPLEFPIEIITKRDGENQTLWGLVLDTHGAGYDTIAICAERNCQTELGRTRAGAWSDWIYRSFIVEGTEQPAAFRCKAIEIAPDASRLLLYRSQVMHVDDFCEPADLSAELVERFGPYLEHASVFPYVWGIADLDTCIEEIEYQCQWIARVGKYLLEEQDYALLYTHIHIFDYINHIFLPLVDPACPGYREENAAEGWRAYRESYKVADRLFGTLLESAPEDTAVSDEVAVMVVSDHAAIPQFRATDIPRLLHDNGYLAYKEPVAHFDPNEDFAKIDMARTKVFITPVRNYELFINAAEGSDEYLRIQREVITLLRSWVDAETGQCPVAVALPKYHAALFGCWGDQCGDIVYAMEDGFVSGYPGGEAEGQDPYVFKPAEYGAHHGPYLPTARTALSSNLAFLLAHGPGLKSGYQRPVDRLGYVHLTSVVPLVSHLLGFEPPAQCQGALPRDFLEGIAPTADRADDLPAWEWGTQVDGWGDRVWTQKRDMFEGFMPGYERKD